MRSVTVTYAVRERSIVPMIRLCGKWLTVAGFPEGQPVLVEVASGRIVLTANSPPLDLPRFGGQFRAFGLLSPALAPQLIVVRGMSFR